jgi:ribA/ribD-fused uncharacterized protein
VSAVVDLEGLLSLVRKGENVKYLTFWSHQSRRPGVVDRACLSQWWPSPFEVGGIRYATAEHYMMAQKARLFRDESILQQILSVSHPGEAKHLGRQVARFSEAEWAKHRTEIVFQGNLAKFGQAEAIKRYLLKTGRRVLVEASPVDTVWGIGLRAEDRRSSDPGRWRGQNLLGFTLMRVREELRGSP